MEKYYTPKIEEFHYGFDFEIIPSIGIKIIDLGKKNEHSETKWSTEFVKMKFGITKGDPNFLGTTYPEVRAAIESKKIRVKHLDREDIESCHKTHFEEVSFKYDNNAEPVPGRTPYECPTAYILDDQLHTGQLWILYHFESDNTVWIEYVKDCAGMGYLFKGIIKNKSELKKVLKMIGV